VKALVRRQSALRRGALSVLPAGALVLAGCIILPVDYHEYGSRHNLTEKTATQLQPGLTTKEEVFLSLGEPDFVSEDGRRLAYEWSKVKALILVGSTASGAVAEAKRKYLLQISFDRQDRLTDISVVKAWGEVISAGKTNTTP
jgi:outer membrane protein assembly factor BamE (lipoprotein component of BamABCDE complex)